MQNNTKSSVVAGILGVFLGAFGGHDWYLGNTKKAITHVSLCVGGIILLMIGLILTNLSKTIPALHVLFICLLIASYIIIVGNGIWGFIEGIVIIAQGDAGLAAKGYQVAGSVNNFIPAANPNMGSVASAQVAPVQNQVLTATPNTAATPVSTASTPTTTITTNTMPLPNQPAGQAAPISSPNDLATATSVATPATSESTTAMTTTENTNPTENTAAPDQTSTSTNAPTA